MSASGVPAQSRGASGGDSVSAAEEKSSRGFGDGDDGVGCTKAAMMSDVVAWRAVRRALTAGLSKAGLSRLSTSTDRIHAFKASSPMGSGSLASVQVLTVALCLVVRETPSISV